MTTHLFEGSSAVLKLGNIFDLLLTFFRLKFKTGMFSAHQPFAAELIPDARQFDIF